MAWNYQGDYLKLKDSVTALDPQIRFYGQVTMESIYIFINKIGTRKF
jgi:hypothetical protein